MEARSFASFTNITYINCTYIYMCCGNGSKTFRVLLPIVCMEARSFASFTNTTILHICVVGRKRNISLLVAHCLYVSEKFRFFY